MNNINYEIKFAFIAFNQYYNFTWDLLTRVGIQILFCQSCIHFPILLKKSQNLRYNLHQIIVHKIIANLPVSQSCPVYPASQIQEKSST